MTCYETLASKLNNDTKYLSSSFTGQTFSKLCLKVGFYQDSGNYVHYKQYLRKIIYIVIQ